MQRINYSPFLKTLRQAAYAGLLITAASLPGMSQAASSKLFDAQDVLNCMALNAPDRNFSQLADIQVRDTSGKQRSMQARILGLQKTGNLLLNIRLTSPGNVAGTAVLVRERMKQVDDIRLYLPALGRTRYISDAMSSTKLFDTDFSYADFKQLYGSFSQGRAEYVNIQKWQGRNVHALRILPNETNNQPYASLLARIDTDSCVIMGIDFLDSENEPQRQLRADPKSLTAIGDRHLAKSYTMSDLLKGSSTTILIKQVDIDTKVPLEAFEPDTFFANPEPESPPAY